MQISDRAKRLVAALHEPSSNEARWAIAEKYLGEEREEAEDRIEVQFTRSLYDNTTHSIADPGGNKAFVPLSEKIAQDRGHDEFP